MLTLHNLKKNKTNAARKKRLGRGNATGSGNYSTRGMKGQRSRSGGKSGLALRSIKGYLLRIPKTRGFKSFRPEMAVVNTGDLEKAFESGSNINFRAILRAGLVKDISKGVKVLAQGKLTKQFNIEANAFSAAAKKQIEAAGGKAIIVKKNKEDKNKKAKE